MSPDEAIKWIEEHMGTDEDSDQYKAMERALSGLKLLKESIRDYLEYCYSGAKMLDDPVECLRISRAIWAYDQDPYHDLKIPE